MKSAGLQNPFGSVVESRNCQTQLMKIALIASDVMDVSPLLALRDTMRTHNMVIISCA